MATAQSTTPKPRAPKPGDRPWSRGFFMQVGPEVNGSHLYYTTSSTRGFQMPIDRAELLAALEPKKETV